MPVLERGVETGCIEGESGRRPTVWMVTAGWYLGPADSPQLVTVRNDRWSREMECRVISTARQSQNRTFLFERLATVRLAKCSSGAAKTELRPNNAAHAPDKRSPSPLTRLVLESEHHTHELREDVLAPAAGNGRANDSTIRTNCS